MNIQQLKQLVADLPDDAEVLTWDRDTANPVEQIITYNLTIEPVDEIGLIEGDESCFEDFHQPPRAALILVCNP